MQHEIVSYSWSWNPRQNRGFLTLRLNEVAEPKQILVRTAGELGALTELMDRSQKLSLNSDDDSIVSGWKTLLRVVE